MNFDLDTMSARLAEWNHQLGQILPLDEGGIAEAGMVRVGALVLLIALIILLLLAFLPAGKRADQDMSLRQMTRGPRIIGWLVVLLFFGIGGVWAAWAPLSSAAVASGVVSPEGRRLTVQHLEGGVIEAIHVADGDHVKRGDPLITLDNVRAEAERDSLLLEHLSLLLEVARISAEQQLLPEIEIPQEVIARKDRAEIASLINAAERLHSDRASVRAARDDIFKGRVTQLETQIEGSFQIEASGERQYELIREEIADVAGLVENGLAPRSRLRSLQREMARLEGVIENTRINRASMQESIENLTLERVDIEQRERRENAERLVQVRRDLNRTRALLPSSEDELARTAILAPEDGTVVELQFSTNGGVLRPGEAVMDIVPAHAELLIEARLSPQDIDDVTQGQPAKVILSAYRQRNLPPIAGRVRQVSADRLIDPATQMAYFEAIIEVPASEVEVVEKISGLDIELTAGMPAEVMIVLGDRSLLDYLFDPFIQSFRRGLTES